MILSTRARYTTDDPHGMIEFKIQISIILIIHILFIIIVVVFFEKKKGDSRVAVIVPCPMVQLGKPMGTTSSNWSSETPNPHIPQALLVSGTSRNCNYSSRKNSNLECNEASAVTYQLYHTCWW